MSPLTSVKPTIRTCEVVYCQMSRHFQSPVADDKTIQGNGACLNHAATADSMNTNLTCLLAEPTASNIKAVFKILFWEITLSCH